MKNTTPGIHRGTLRRFRAELEEVMRTVRHLRSAIALLSWDQETQMPPKATERRAQQMSTLENLVHRELISPRVQRLAARAERIFPHLPERDQRMVRLFLREHRRATALPPSLVEELARTQTLAVASWRYAKKENDFYLFAPYLQRLIELKRKQAECYGYAEHLYDALLDLYEPGMRLSTIHPLIRQLAQRMQELLQWTRQIPYQPPTMLPPAPCAAQFVLGRHLCVAIGFDPERGRIDYSAHPFCTALAPNDVRMTTRCSEDEPRTCIYSLLHESGHALYDQNIPDELADTFAGDGASMGIHESQSLFWEDIVGRSLAFCRWAAPIWRQYLNGMLNTPWTHLTAEQLFRALNYVQPSLIRTEADEVTYHMHILLRLEIELALLEGNLRVKELPEAWNSGMDRLLGLHPPDDRTGCLQDIHWSLGEFGYFPTYSIGKLYAAMFWKQLQRDVPDIEERIASGEFELVLSWLKQHIYAVGALETPQEIVQRVTGRTLTIEDFAEYIAAKLQHVYSATL
ncbi:MAG: carboxypeptidase M32 [Candidatus Kapabacteria bacterium]|nr:carboxypeptidase M32 [Candidatus Kapabacteria bacterium]